MSYSRKNNKNNSSNSAPETRSNSSKFSTKFSIIHEASTKIVSEYDQEIPQSQTADNPVAPRGRAAQLSRDTRKTN